MELAGKTVYGPVLKTMQLSARVQNHASLNADVILRMRRTLCDL